MGLARPCPGRTRCAGRAEEGDKIRGVGYRFRDGE